MRNYIAVAFDDTGKAYEGLHALWQLDGTGDVTVHGTAVVHRDEWGQFQVDTKETHPAAATAVGVGLGALLGALAGPAGAVAGAAAAAAAGGAALGAVAGGTVGAATDLARADTRAQAAREAGFVLGAGQSAVIADVTEDWTSVIDTRMRSLGGTVHRRAKSDVSDDAWFDDDYLYPGDVYPYDYYLYPYEYIPSRYPLW